MSIPFLYSESFIELLKAKSDPNIPFDQIIKEVAKTDTNESLFALSLEKSTNGDVLPFITSGLNRIANFYDVMIKASNEGINVLQSPDWISNRVDDHIAILTLYKNYLEEVALQELRQCFYQPEEQTNINEKKLQFLEKMDKPFIEVVDDAVEVNPQENTNA